MATSDKNTISLSEFYEENLYRLQDGVLNIVKNCGTPLYLTGGTALSRAYYRHRYSDDLDFFVNNDNSFNQYVDAVLDGAETRFRKRCRRTLWRDNRNGPVLQDGFC